MKSLFKFEFGHTFFIRYPNILLHIFLKVLVTDKKGFEFIINKLNIIKENLFSDVRFRTSNHISCSLRENIRKECVKVASLATILQ